MSIANEYKLLCPPPQPIALLPATVPPRIPAYLRFANVAYTDRPRSRWEAMQVQFAKGAVA